MVIHSLSSAHAGDAAATTPYTFKAGYPTGASGRHAAEDADFQRAVTAYRFWYPTVSMQAIFEASHGAGLKDNEAMFVMATGPRHVGFTLNSDTPYAAAVLDLRAGPIVIDVPPGPYIGLVDDHHQRWIVDVGLPSPDRDKGGKVLLVPPGDAGEVPAGYRVGRASSVQVFLAVRALPLKGEPAALDALRAVRIYPLASAASPPPIETPDMTSKPMDFTPLRWEHKLKFWKVLASILDTEPSAPELAAMQGLLAPLGIVKGKPFAPDARQRALLERAARVGRDQLLVSAWESQRADKQVWSDRRWEWAGLIADNGNFETPSGLDLEARDRWFAQAIAASPAMFRRTSGAGSLYWLGLRDSSGAYLDGGQHYKLSIPLPVPAKLFWSVTVYDAQTRSQVQTDRDQAALRSLFELKDAGQGRRVDLYFGPSAPRGQETRWIQTVPGRGWFVYLRLYAPAANAFDGQWKPGDFERVAVESLAGPV
jgi:hypothetical protein